MNDSLNSCCNIILLLLFEEGAKYHVCHVTPRQDICRGTSHSKESLACNSQIKTWNYLPHFRIETTLVHPPHDESPPP